MKTYLYPLALLVAVCFQGHAKQNERIAELGDYLILSSGEDFFLSKIYLLKKDTKIKLSNYHKEIDVTGLNKSGIKNEIIESFIFQPPEEPKVTVEIIKKREVEEKIKGGEIPVVLLGGTQNKLCWVSKGTTVKEFIDSLEEYPRNRFRFAPKVSAHSKTDNESPDRIRGFSEERWEAVELIAHDEIYAYKPFTNINQNQSH